jgi:hypothetical protein
MPAGEAFAGSAPNMPGLVAPNRPSFRLAGSGKGRTVVAPPESRRLGVLIAPRSRPRDLLKRSRQPRRDSPDDKINSGDKASARRISRQWP